MKNNTLNHRMAELAWQAYHGDYNDIITLCDAMDIKADLDNNVLKLNGRVITVIYNGLDPITIFCCLGFAFFGEYWTYVCGDGMKELNKMWKEEVREDRGV